MKGLQYKTYREQLRERGFSRLKSGEEEAQTLSLQPPERRWWQGGGWLLLLSNVIRLEVMASNCTSEDSDWMLGKSFSL